MFVAGDHAALHCRRSPKDRLRHLQGHATPPARSDSQQVTIRILARDDERNTRPEPKNLTGRVVAGMTVKIPVPLDGIDADGDSVQLIGMDKAAAMGTAVVRDGYLEFTAAGNGAGTDTFTLPGPGPDRRREHRDRDCGHRPAGSHQPETDRRGRRRGRPARPERRRGCPGQTTRTRTATRSAWSATVSKRARTRGRSGRRRQGAPHRPGRRRQREHPLPDPGRQKGPGQRRDPDPDQPGRRAEAAHRQGR